VGIRPGSSLAQIVAGRADILARTQAAYEAVLRPQVPGALTYAERAALACRMTRLSGEDRLAEHYATLIPLKSEAAAGSRLADPAFSGGGERRLTAMLRHVDLVTQTPQRATRADIDALREAGFTEADIVRLAELIAFISYQVRVVAGLRLLGETL
jgi:uncharacterized protein YciW